MNFELGLREFQKLFWETTVLQKTIWSSKIASLPFYKNENNFLHSKGFMQTAFQKALLPKPFSKKASLQNPMH